MSMSGNANVIPYAPRRFVSYALAAVVVVAVLVIGAAIAIRQTGDTDPLAGAINPSEYQAVFLTSGQVYFGKLSASGGDFYDLRHIYYLQSQVSPQGGRGLSQHLVKLGSEIHGPEDLMIINRTSILFVENLKPSGKVSQAIASAPNP